MRNEKWKTKRKTNRRREGEPVEYLSDAVEVAEREIVSDSVGEHDLRATELSVRVVHTATEHSVQRLRSCTHTAHTYRT